MSILRGRRPAAKETIIGSPLPVKQENGLFGIKAQKYPGSTDMLADGRPPHSLVYRANEPYPPLLGAALEYAARGWAVVPSFSPRITPLGTLIDGQMCTCGAPDCRVPGKHPRIEHGYRFASHSVDQIRQWWTEHPEDNIQIASGSRSQLLILDIDFKNLGNHSLQSLTRQYGELPPTVKALTGGGEHYYFRTPPFEVRGRIGMHPGIDVRGEDQLFTAPPSRHFSGAYYRWAPNQDPSSIEMTFMPEWLLTQVLTKRPRKPHKRRS